MSRGIFSWLVFFGLALGLLVVLQRQWQAKETIRIDEFNKYVQNKEVDEITLHGDKISGHRRLTQPNQEGSKPNFQVSYPPNAIDSAFIKDLSKRLP
ncbi:MAG TPA: ATP-dependent metallopeptidase FtsH/Yme1/Tma family protein, partial [Phycisphaerae bacterium]